MDISSLDLKLIDFFKKISEPVARAGIFIIFFWFGFLKIIGFSPASDLVQNLFTQTMPVISFSTFIIIFGGFECIIGLLFLVKGWERVVIPFLFLHLVTTFLPLWLLSGDTWASFLVPTMAGQYIIKNLIIVALTIGIASHLKPLTKPKKKKAKKKTIKVVDKKIDKTKRIPAVTSVVKVASNKKKTKKRK